MELEIGNWELETRNWKLGVLYPILRGQLIFIYNSGFELKPIVRLKATIRISNFE